MTTGTTGTAQDTSSPAAAARGRFGNRRVGAARTTCPCPVRIHIHLDANRDGQVDERWWLNASWTPGQGRLGAVVLCNCDDEDGTQNAAGEKEEDHTNNAIDGAADNSDIAPFYLRKHPARGRAPRGWKVVVEVLGGRESLFRIFSNERAAGTQLLGPVEGGNVPSFEITDLAPAEWKYGMETNQYPGRIKDPENTGTGTKPPGRENIWDGYIDVKLTLYDRENVPRDTEQAKIRCAPWMIFNHADATQELFVVNVPAGGVSPTGQFIADLDAASEFPATQFPDRDRWMQDVMELGFSTLPRPAPSPDMHLPVSLRTRNPRRNLGRAADYSKTHLLGRNHGYYEALRPIGEFVSMDSFGNLECVPPFVHPRTRFDYKFGRIIYGHGGGVGDMATEVTEFLIEQKAQFPFDVDTGWLHVGHIDEVLSFVPTPDGALGFKAIFAGPRRALDLIRGRAASPGVPAIRPLPRNTPVFRGITGFNLPFNPEYSNTVAEYYEARTVGDLLDQENFHIVSASENAQTKIDQIKQKLRDEIGMTDADFIDLPILFDLVYPDATSGPDVPEPKHIAYTGGSANMLVVTHGPQTRAGERTVRLVIPKPFGPTRAPPGATGSAAPPCVFEADIAQALRLTGVTHRFVDNFATYHLHNGEIHCGTNSRRKGALDRFWWEQEGI